MVKVITAEKKIWDIEGFAVEFKKTDGTNVRSDKRNIPQYERKYAAKNSMTVSEWKQKRFNSQYPGFNVDVLDGDGNPVPGQTLLGTVRDSYNEDDDESTDETSSKEK